MISWKDAREFVKKLKIKEGRNYRLPTEAEWEHAASSYGKYKDYTEDVNVGQFGWHQKNSGWQTHKVGEKLPNNLGLYDMFGNVYEWCQDWYDDKYYGKSPVNNPQGPFLGIYCVFRGGSCFDDPKKMEGVQNSVSVNEKLI